MLPPNLQIKHENKVKFGAYVQSGGGALEKRGFRENFTSFNNTKI